MSTISKHTYKTVGIIFIVIDLFWLYMNAERLYGQNYGGKLYLFWIPNCILIFNVIISLICLYFSINIFREKNCIRGLIVNVVLLGLGFFLFVW
jgi:uncharacterized membrane protein